MRSRGRSRSRTGRPGLIHGPDRPGHHHGDRAGTHGVPADLLVRPPASSFRPARLGRPFIKSLAFARRAPRRDADRRCSSTSATTGCGWSPRGLRHDARPVVRRRPRPAARLLLLLSHHPGGRHRRCCSTTSSRARCASIGLVALMMVVGAGVLWAADRWGTRDAHHRPADRPRRRWHRPRAGVGAHARRAAGPGISSRRPCSQAWTAPTPCATASSWRRRSPRWPSPTRRSSSLRGETSAAPSPRPLVAGVVASFVAGILAIRVLLRYVADAVVHDLRRVPGGAGRGRRRDVPGPLGGLETAMEVMKQLRQRAIRDLVEQRPIRTQQELAAALRERGFRTTQATISRDVAELGLVKAGRNGTHAYAIPPRLREADTSGEDRHPPAPRATCRSRCGRPGPCSSCARCRVPRTRWPRRWTVRGGPRWWARSPATTRSSWRSPTAARWGACGAGWRGWPSSEG